MKRLLQTAAPLAGALMVATVWSLPSHAVTGEEAVRLSKLCQGRCSILQNLQYRPGIDQGYGYRRPTGGGVPWLFDERGQPVPMPEPKETPFEKANKAAIARGDYSVIQQGETIWFVNEKSVSPVTLKSTYSGSSTSVNLGFPNRVTSESVLFYMLAKSDQGTTLRRDFVGNCLTQERRAGQGGLGQPVLYHLSTQELKAGKVVRQNAPSILKLSKDEGEIHALRVACYLAYDVPVIKAILSRGSLGGDPYERGTPSLPASPSPTQVIDVTSVESGEIESSTPPRKSDVHPAILETYKRSPW